MDKDFIWGTATASYQIEGAWDKDGKGPNIWDDFTHQEGHIQNGDTGDVACDFYRKWPEDVALLKKAGIPHFRMSLSWSRILPDGTGDVNQQGIDFYNQVFDGLIEAGITPWVTLYHWDLPSALHEKGGWENRQIIDWFSEYVDVVQGAFGDRVKNWMILNEPNIFAWLGYCLGFHAPGKTGEEPYLKATHHENLVIGRIARQMKQADPSCRVGSCYQIAPIKTIDPNTSEESRQKMHNLWNDNYLIPLFEGHYPGEFQQRIENLCWHDGDAEVMKAPLDFVGVQHYNPIYMKTSDDHPFGCFFGDVPADLPTTDYDWPIDSTGLRDVLGKFKETYGSDIDLIVTENGAAYFDEVVDGACDDQRRVDYLNDHISVVEQCAAEGANVVGYFVWSFLDNFEWADGYKYRFGLVHVDYENACKRTPKLSMFRYSEIIENNGVREDAGNSPRANAQ